MSSFDAIVLAGGKATRLGGLDKALLDVAGRPMLEWVLDACSGARATVAVGIERPTSRAVTWTLEDPPHGGPLAGIGAGLGALPADAERVVVLAADMPFMTSDAVSSLLTSLPGHDAAVFTDDGGNVQPLAGVYHVRALTSALVACGDLRGGAAMRVLTRLDAVKVRDNGATRDCDTVDQVDAARQALRRA